MNRTVKISIVAFSAILLSGCLDKKYEQGERHMKQPINCATAEGDIRVLQHEKAHVAEQVAEGVMALAPAGIVIGILTGTEGTKAKVAVGEYNKAIDKRIADIKRTCGTP